MPLEAADNRARFIFSLSGSKWKDPRKTDANADYDLNSVLHVSEFECHEGISTLYEVQLTLIEWYDDAPQLKFDDIVDKEATLTIFGRDSDRFVHGIVRSVALTDTDITHQGERKAVYQLVLVPPHHRLQLRHNLRIFQKKTTEEIIKEVLGDWNITALEWEPQKSYTARDYCVQYRESDFDFIARLLEEEGIAYHFRHEADSVTMVLMDGKDLRQPIAGDNAVPFSAAGAMKHSEHINAFALSQQMVPDKVELRDYWFKAAQKPQLGQDVGEKKEYEIYDYPGEFSDSELGNRLAKVRHEESRVGYQTGEGTSDCVRLVPGFTFELGKAKDKHPVDMLNQSYLLLRCRLSGDQSHIHRRDTVTRRGRRSPKGDTFVFNVHFITMPAALEFQPPRNTARPKAYGNHTAQVVGPEEDEIYTDPFGRVKVAFHWDRDQWSNKSDSGYSGWRDPDEKASCWIRVSQFWAGQGYGALFLPRVGHEVLVSFIEGDPDRPLITGRVYNELQEVPGLIGGTYGPEKATFEQGPPELKEDETTKPGLPINKTRSVIRSSSSKGGEGSNELRFEDKAGEEHFYIHAQRDYYVEVENNRHSLVRANRIEMVNHNDKLWVNNDRFLHVKETSHHTGKHVVVQAENKIILECGSSRIEMDPNNIYITTSGELVVESSGRVTVKGSSKTDINPPGPAPKSSS